VIAREMAIPPKRHDRTQLTYLVADEITACTGLRDQPDPARYHHRPPGSANSPA
jgi:hypothetical protein